MLFRPQVILPSIAKMISKVVFVLGGPGAGKGTQCQRISDTFGFAHLSAGDLLRNERATPDSEYGEMIENYIRDGRIVPGEITCRLLKRSMQQCESNKILIDGFPRNQDNLNEWRRHVDNECALLFVLYFNCPLEVCTSRCLARGAAGSGRSDDNVDSVTKRVRTYLQETQPVIDYFRQLNVVHEIDATKSADEVFEKVQKLFD